MKPLFLALAFLLAAPDAFADQVYTVTWRELMQNKYPGRIRQIAWGSGPTVYDYNTPFFVEVIVCPVWFRGRDAANVVARDISVGGSSRYSSEFWETDCRVLATSRSHTTSDGKTSKLDEALTFTEAGLHSAIDSIKHPSWLRRSPDRGARPVSGEAGYVLRVMMINDYSILPLIPRVLGRVGMRTALNVIADYYVELPALSQSPKDVDIPAMNGKIRAAGVELRPWSRGTFLEQSHSTFRYKIEVGQSR